MKVRIDYINIRIPIFRLSRGVPKCSQRYPIADMVSVGSVVMTKDCLDIGLVADVFEGRPKKILARYSGCNLLTGGMPQYGGIYAVTWYDTGVHMSVEDWVKLSSKTDANGFYEYWRTRLCMKG